jgi:outer membrane protein assembly factor BamB
MDMYCSTRANVAPVPAPTSPAIAWTSSFPANEFETPDFLAVDANNVTYAGFDVLSAATPEPPTLVAIGADGSLAWTQTFAGNVVGDLFLGTDGKLRAFRGSHVLSPPSIPPTLSVLGAGGAIEQTFPLPVTMIAGTAVGRDGSLYAHLGAGGPGFVARLTATGTLVWTSSLLDCSFRVVLTEKDHPILTECATPVVSELDENGNLVWQTQLTSMPGRSVVAVAQDGSIRAVAPLSMGESSTSVFSLDATGEILWSTAIPWTHGAMWAGQTLAIAPDGTAIVFETNQIIAVSRTGEVLWTHLELSVGEVVVGSDGTIVVASGEGTLVALDVATGALKWTLSDGSGRFTGPFALGLGGSVVACASVPPAGSGLFGLVFARDP